MKTSKQEMSVSEHLTELRKTILICAATVGVFMCLAMFFVDELTAYLTKESGYSFIYTSPEMLAVVKLKTALVTAFITSAPITIFVLWRFVKPGLKPSERVAAVPVIVGALVMFVTGAGFGYKIILPVMLKFFKSMETGAISAYISISEYMNFVILVSMTFGIGFELPIAMTAADIVGIVKGENFEKCRKYAVVVIFFVSALLTPADLLSMLITATPMTMVYELGIVLIKLRRRRVKTRARNE